MDQSTESETVEQAQVQAQETIAIQDHLRIGLDRMRQGDKQCDVSIVVGTRLLKAHKIILSACSDYFYAMFTGDMKEANEGLVTLYEVDEDAVKAIIEFIYNDHLIISDSTVQNLLAAANMLQIPGVKTRCAQYIEANLDTDNCIGIIQLADKYSCPELLKSSIGYTSLVFDEVAKSEDFLTLTVDQLMGIVSSEQLKTTSENLVYEAIICWTDHDESRAKHLSSLLTHVRFSQMDSSYLETVSSDLFTRAENNDHTCAIKTMAHLLLDFSRVEITRELPDEQKRLFVFGGADYCGIHSPDIYSYDPYKDTWSKSSPMFDARFGHQVVLLNDIIYIVGGQSLCGTTKYMPRDLFTFNHEISKASKNRIYKSLTAPLSIGRMYMGLIAHKGFIYVMGGRGDNLDALNLVEKLDPVNNKWIKCAPLPTGRSELGLAVFNDSIYALGGVAMEGEEKMIVNTLERYDPIMDKWSRMAPMIVKRSGFGCIAFDNYIYAIGGGNKEDGYLNSVERYNPKIDCWSALNCRMQHRRRDFGVAVLGRKIYVVGGYNGGIISNVEVFEPDKMLWSSCAPMPVGVYETAVAPSE